MGTRGELTEMTFSALIHGLMYGCVLDGAHEVKDFSPRVRALTAEIERRVRAAIEAGGSQVRYELEGDS